MIKLMVGQKQFLSSFYSQFMLKIIIFAVMVLTLVSVSAAASPERISIAYCKDSVPFHFSDENGQKAGIIIDMWRLWSKKTGIAINFRVAAWDDTLTMVRSGKADAHAGLFYNKERDKFLDYGAVLTKTDNYLQQIASFFAIGRCLLDDYQDICNFVSLVIVKR